MNNEKNTILAKLKRDSIDSMLALQSKAILEGDDIIESSKNLFERAFQFENFVYGITLRANNDLLGFCNCSIPTEKSIKNLGRNLIPDNQLNFVGHINTLIIAKDYRREGFARQIISAVLGEFEKKKLNTFLQQ